MFDVVQVGGSMQITSGSATLTAGESTEASTSKRHDSDVLGTVITGEIPESIHSKAVDTREVPEPWNADVEIISLVTPSGEYKRAGAMADLAERVALQAEGLRPSRFVSLILDLGFHIGVQAQDILQLFEAGSALAGTRMVFWNCPLSLTEVALIAAEVRKRLSAA